MPTGELSRSRREGSSLSWQIGYQQENLGLRNSFRAAAYELRSGIPAGDPADSSSPDVVRAMSTELFLNFMGIRRDSRKAEGMRFTINLITPDHGEKLLIELENATLTKIKGFLADKPALTLTINRSDLEQTMRGAKTLEAQIADGTAKAAGNTAILKQLGSTMSWPFTDASAITVQFVGNRSANAPPGRSSLGTYGSANARYAALMDFRVLRPRSWIAITSVALILWLPVAAALA